MRFARRFRIPSFIFASLLALPHGAWTACQCSMSNSPCGEVAGSDVVFIGKVELIQPMFLSRWNTTSPGLLRTMNEAYAAARENPSQAALDRLRDAYLKAFPEIAPEDKRRVQAAQTLSNITSTFYSSLDRGMHVRFRVKTLFKYQDDGDDDRKKTPSASPNSATTAQVKKAQAPAAKGKDKNGKDDDDDKAPDVLEVEAPFGDCAIDFQEGETYLVYANSDEDSNVLSTTSCTRTERLTSAGDDLAYLYFYKNQPKESARLEGFVTAESPYDPLTNSTHDATSIHAPAPGAVIELQNAGLIRYADSDANGRFIFDGLAAGDYTLSAFGSGYPVDKTVLGGPQSFHIGEQSCVQQTLWLPKQIK